MILLVGFVLLMVILFGITDPWWKLLKGELCCFLDEIDLASNKILCLQPVLEGKGLFLKKIGKFVQPAAGFNIIATANTKGRDLMMVDSLVQMYK